MEKILTILITLLVGTIDAAPQAPAGSIVLERGKTLVDPSVSAPTSREKKTLFSGDTLRTQKDSRLKIQLGFEIAPTLIILEAESTLELISISNATTDTLLNLPQGTVRIDVNHKHSGKKGDSFTIKTPNAQIKVRGTVFTVSHDQKKRVTEIVVEKGMVEVESSLIKESTRLASGKSLRIVNE
jgi:hypothetical protein